MRKIIERCPACGGDLIVTRLRCSACETEISGRFRATAFGRLSPDSLAFAETFVRLRGNVKEMERELGVPYSAVRSRLDEVIEELGFVSAPQPVEAPEPAPAPSPGPDPSPSPDGDLAGRRRAVLDRLDRGEITASEAAEILAQLKS